LQKGSFSFDASVLEIFLPLIAGAQIIVAKPDGERDVDYLAQLIIQWQVTYIDIQPALLESLLVHPGMKDCKSIRLITCGGEALRPETVQQCHEILTTNFWNEYGPTEATVQSTYTSHLEGPRVPIGQPIANTEVYVLGDAMELVPVGGKGELYIGGVGVARGYLDRPELTAQRFVPNPFNGNDGERLYRTGDLARWRADGNLEFLGRADEQIKIRGYRIELGEIEQVLLQHSGVKDAVAMAQEDQDGNKRIVAYYISVAGARLKSGELAEFLQRKLPNYMIPSWFVEMEGFPVTPNGKIHRKGLPRPEGMTPEASSPSVEPEGELELQLADIWKRALKKQDVGANDNFFDLGGHSLLAAYVFAQMDRLIGVKLPLAILFQAPTIRQLATRVREKSCNWKSLVAIQTRGCRPPIFLVHGAEGNVLLYKNLARKLGNDQPVYGLQSRGLDGCEKVETRIEDMAAHYVEEIQRLQPKGPYFLGGYCMGGTIALEIAQQLRRAGEAIALLAMLETYNLEGLPEVSSFPLRTIYKAQNLYFNLTNLLLSLSQGGFDFFLEKIKVEFSRMKMTWNILWSTMLEKLNYEGVLQYQHLQVRTVNDQAQAAYRTVPYDGTITVFRTKTYYCGLHDWDFGWGHIARQGVHVVKLLHYPRGSLNDPFVDVLAERLSAEIENALPRPPR
jgi:thioesterase domain-containing protein